MSSGRWREDDDEALEHGSVFGAVHDDDLASPHDILSQETCIG